MLVLALIATLLSTSLLALFLFATVEAWQSKRWPCTLGSLEAAFAMSRDNSHIAHVRYRYEILDIKYEGHRLATMAYSSASEKQVERVLLPIREQAARDGGVRVYFNPADHGRSVLWPGPRAGHFAGILGLGIAVIGCWVWVGFAI